MRLVINVDSVRWPGRAFGSGHDGNLLGGRRPRWQAGRGLPATPRTGVLVDQVLDVPQRCWTVLQLLALVHADVHTDLATASADTLGLGEFMMSALARQRL